MNDEEKAILDRQIQDWQREIKRLADQIAAAKGMPSAIVMITPQDVDYADTVPELIAEDAFRVYHEGWPAGFEVEVLNRAD